MKKQTWQQWARVVNLDTPGPSKLFKGALGALTGQDVRAMNVFVAALELYSNSDEDGERAGLAAMCALLPAMQKSVQWIARELIPFVLDWDDRERLWPRIIGDVAGVTDGGAVPITAGNSTPYASSPNGELRVWMVQWVERACNTVRVRSFLSREDADKFVEEKRKELGAVVCEPQLATGGLAELPG